MRADRPSVFGSPVLVGAITVLVLVVGVFLAYNANKGLPFVPTYDLEAKVPNAANLVVGNDVRIGGNRVGVVSDIKPIRAKDGKTAAVVGMKLEKSVEPLSKDSKIIIRPRSALGLKYVEITPGTRRAGFAPGDTIPERNATPKPVEIDEVFNTFTKRTRTGIEQSLRGFGDGLAGRGQGLNEAIAALRPLVDRLLPVAQNLSAPETRFARLFRELEAAASEVSPVAEEQASLFKNLDITFGALADVAPSVQEFIRESPPTEDTVIRELPRQRPFLRNSAALFRELRPGVHTLPTAMPILSSALSAGIHTLPRTPELNRELEDVFRALDRFVADPAVPRAIKRLDQTVRALKPTLDFLTPAQTVCNYPTLWFRNIASHLSLGDNNGTWQRFIIVAAPQGPNNEGGPSSKPADGPNEDNHLHANPYPNTAGPGETRECEAANEDYYVGKTTIGNVPGNQGTTTEKTTR
jgi:virulence factor Mce-like protein